MHRQRARVKANEDISPRRIWERFIDGSGAEAALRGDAAAAEQKLDELLSDAAQRGEVNLVGAGPGATDLLTFRALRLMQQCDGVLYDRLVSAELMVLVRRDAERQIGKPPGRE